MKSDIVFILSSCNEYSFLWDGFFYCLGKNWNSFDYKVVMTSSIPYNKRKNVFSINCNPTKSWSTRLIKALKSIDNEVVFLCLDDFYFTRNVDIQFIEHAINIMKSDKRVMSITLNDYPSHNKVSNGDYDLFFTIKNNKYKYSVCSQFSLWNRKYLLKLLHRGESAWDFELLGSLRQAKYNSLFLYRKDDYEKCAHYPVGGVLLHGRYGLENIETKKILDEIGIDYASLQYPLINDKKQFSFFKSYLINLYRKFYHRLSAFIAWLPYI